MFPVLVDCRVRGAADDVYLHNFKKGFEYVIEQKHAQILNSCDGAHSIDDISKLVSIPAEDIKEFLSVLQKEGLLKCEEHKIDPIGIHWTNKDPFLREVHIDITGTCNLFGHCKHCYGRSNLEACHRNELNTEELYSLIDQMGAMGVADCVISGGEPFLRKDLPLIIQRLAKNSVHCIGLFTNGTIYRQDVIDALKKENYTTFFFISLDGYTQQMHEFLRGKDTFLKTMDFIDKIDKEGFPVIINTMVTKSNVNSLMDFCHFLEEKHINRWRLSVPREQGETIFHKDIIIPEWNDVFKSYKELLEYCLVKKSRMKVQIGSIFKSELLQEPEYYLYNDCNSCCEYKRWSIVVKPNGNVTPCTAFDNLVFGNIRKNSLSDIWYSEPTQMFKTLPVGKTDCKDCKIRQYCGGGCRKMAWELHKNCLAKDETSCPLYEFAAEVAQPILKKHGIMDFKLKEVPRKDFDYSKLANYIK